MSISKEAHAALVGLHNWATGTGGMRPPVRITFRDIQERLHKTIEASDFSLTGTEVSSEVIRELAANGQLDEDEKRVVCCMLFEAANKESAQVWFEKLRKEVPARLRELIFVLAWSEVTIRFWVVNCAHNGGQCVQSRISPRWVIDMLAMVMPMPELVNAEETPYVKEGA